MNTTTKPSFYENYKLNLLIVDDDPPDVDLAIEILDDSEANFNRHAVKDGIEALAFLRHESPYETSVEPDLVLLDLNMPKTGGREVLKAIRNDALMCHTPVMVRTTSDDTIDICKSYQLGANCYMTKPVGLPRYAEFVEKLEMFWFNLIQLPRECSL